MVALHHRHRSAVKEDRKKLRYTLMVATIQILTRRTLSSELMLATIEAQGVSKRLAITNKRVKSEAILTQLNRNSYTYIYLYRNSY
jgi:hypothetical protein